MSKLKKIIVLSVLVILGTLPFLKTTAKTTSYADPLVKGITKTVSTTVAFVTKYSSVESCSNAKCIMASGKSAYVGAAACPRKYKLGTKVDIDGVTYTCEDRTALWIEKSRSLPTFDIFAGYGSKAHKDAIRWGIQKRTVKI